MPAMEAINNPRVEKGVAVLFEVCSTAFTTVGDCVLQEYHLTYRHIEGKTLPQFMITDTSNLRYRFAKQQISRR